jgi:hypothetical protein
MSLNRNTLLVAMTALLFAITGSNAHALVISASSNGYGLDANLNFLGLNVSAGPLPVGVSGTSPAPYNLVQSVLNPNVSSNIPLIVTANVGASAVNATATSNVDGLSGSRLATASGGVVGADLNATTLPLFGPGISLFGLDGTLSSTAQISGNHGALVATGTTTIENLALSVGLINVPLGAYVGVNVAPNTSVNLGALGIVNASLILNEQIIAGDNSSITVNAFRLRLGALGVVGTDVILGHSHVQMATTPPVPEPATIGLLVGAALLPVGWRSRRSR